MKRLAALLLVASCFAAADVGLKQGTTVIGPVRDISCVSDGGLYCSRDAGTAIGSIRCVGATATETGCVTPSAQTFAGDKTFTGDPRIVGHVHGSLTACSSGVKGMWPTCTTHNAPVFCDGTANQELIGSSGSEEVLLAWYVDGIPVPFANSVTLDSASTWTINAVAGMWVAGTGSGSLLITLVHTGGTCTCTIDCDVPGARTACSGNCTVAASASLGMGRGTSTCTLDPRVVGNLHVMGTRP